MIRFRHDYWQVENRFSVEAVERIHEITKGVPRDSVVLCGYAMSQSDEAGGQPIRPADIDRAAEHLLLRSSREVAA